MGADLLLYVRALRRHWAALVTGGVAIAVLWVVEGVGWFRPPRSFYGVASGAALIVAMFLAWREERRRVEAVERELADLRTVPETPIPDLRDDLYWYIVIAQKHGMRRQYHTNFNSSQQASSLWVGERPVWHTEEGLWFYHLMTHAERAGLFKEEAVAGNVIRYRLTEEALTILEIERKRRRVAKAPPGPIFNALTGEPMTIPLPG